MAHKIVEKIEISELIYSMKVEAAQIAKKRHAGQFIVIRLHEEGERVPLTIADADPENGTISIVVQRVGKSTIELGNFQVGDSILDIAGPLGHPTEIEPNGKVICVGGGLGIAPLYPITKALKENGNHVTSIIGARSKDLLFWEDEMRAVSDELIIVTDDGSYGEKGLVTMPLDRILAKDSEVKRAYCVGPVPMMKFVCLTTKKYEVPTIVSLNSIMIDGTGMCGGCRVKVGDENKFACVDGPEFDGHLVDFDQLMQRLNYYKDQEKHAVHQHKCRMGESLDEKS